MDGVRIPEAVQAEAEVALKELITCFEAGSKLLVCGNGGSAADSDHIVGELVKGFMKKRPLTAELRYKLQAMGVEESLVRCLQGGLPAINLGAHTALVSATINDLGAECMYAQQVIGYGKTGDVLIGISTSGNSKNVLAAIQTAKAKGLRTIGLTGSSGGIMESYCDVVIHAPACCTPQIQEYHVMIYHWLCAQVETYFWGE